MFKFRSFGICLRQNKGFRPVQTERVPFSLLDSSIKREVRGRSLVNSRQKVERVFLPSRYFRSTPGYEFSTYFRSLSAVFTLESVGLNVLRYQKLISWLFFKILEDFVTMTPAYTESQRDWNMVTG